MTVEEQVEAVASTLTRKQGKNFWAHFSPKQLKLHLAKQVLNYTAPKLNKLIPYRKPKCVVSKIIDESFREITGMLKEGKKTKRVFGDNNFTRLIDSTRRTLVYMCEEDPYYRMWLEILLLSLYIHVKQDAVGLEAAEQIYIEKRYVL